MSKVPSADTSLDASHHYVLVLSIAGSKMGHFAYAHLCLGCLGDRPHLKQLSCVILDAREQDKRYLITLVRDGFEDVAGPESVLSLARAELEDRFLGVESMQGCL